jgi:glycosyltransferase involved in cell wall biosynthesis
MKLLVINDAGIKGGGAENRIRLLLVEFQKRGFFEEIHILQSKTEAVDKTGGFIIHTVDPGYISSYRATARVINKTGIDIVQTHNMLALTPSGILAAHELKIPIVWFAHDYWPLCAKRSFIDPYEASKKQLCKKTSFLHCVDCSGLKTQVRLWGFRQVLGKSDLSVASCNFVKNLYESHNFLKGKWEVVKPWVETDCFLSRAEVKRDSSVVFTGSLLDYKGAWVLAEAFIEVIKVLPDARLKFAGSEQEFNSRHRKRLDDIFSKYGVANRVKFLGYLNWDKLLELYKGSGVYACPTVCMESFGLNWAEAMAAGCPVVASDIGSLPDFLKGRAILVTPRDKDKLAEGIISVLKDKSLAEELSRKGIEYIENNFRVKHSADEILNLYSHLLN